jgi:isocitrate/isopropylmalate dehydrogenase
MIRPSAGCHKGCTNIPFPFVTIKNCDTPVMQHHTQLLQKPLYSMKKRRSGPLGQLQGLYWKQNLQPHQGLNPQLCTSHYNYTNLAKFKWNSFITIFLSAALHHPITHIVIKHATVYRPYLSGHYLLHCSRNIQLSSKSIGELLRQQERMHGTTYMAAVPSPWDPAQKRMNATYSVLRNRLANFSNLHNIYIQPQHTTSYETKLKTKAAVIKYLDSKLLYCKPENAYSTRKPSSKSDFSAA